MTDASGNVTSSETYDDSFGNGSGNLATRYRFTGREYDDFTGLYYYRARWYDSNLGRFISEDPIGFAGGDVNLYGYVGNRPLEAIDPMGLDVLAFYYRNGGRGRGGRLEVIDYGPPPHLVVRQNPYSSVGVEIPEDGLPSAPPVDYWSWEYPRYEVEDGLFSGQGQCRNQVACERIESRGPIPSGEYVIADAPRPDKRRGPDRWYALYRRQPDGSYSDRGAIDYSGTIRGNYRWHLGSLSAGCLTFDITNPNAWKPYRQLDSAFQSTPKMTFRNADNRNRVEQGYGTLYVF